MSHQYLQGVLRPAFYFSSRTALVFLLAVLPAFSQKQAGPVPADKADKTDKTAASRGVAEMNQRIAELALASDVRQGDYVIGSGDLLTIDVFDVPELSRDVRVNETGYISLPLIPSKIRAQGLTPYQLQDKLAELLQTNGLVSTPQVTVSLREQHSEPITIIGSVRTPLVIQALRTTTLLQALSQAGGIAEDAGNTVIVTRTIAVQSQEADGSDSHSSSSPQTFTINLADLLDSGDSRFNIPLVGGDVVSVPKAGIIYVVGAVQRPGGFMLQNDTDHMTMLKMLSLAGGTTSTAKLKKSVILRKNPDTGKRDQVPVDLKKVLTLKSQDIQLEASDILFVPDSEGLKVLHRTGDVALAVTTGVGIVAAGRI